MSVQRNFTCGSGPHLSTRILLLGLALVALWAASPGWAQEELVDAATPAGADGDLWNRVVERYEVVVLSRGMLLEPLGEGVELLTIEVIDDRVAIGGDTLSESELRDRIGDESAALILELAAMDPSARRQMFETGGPGEETLETAVAAEEAAAESWADEGEEHKEHGDQRHYRDSQVAVGNSLTVGEDEVAKEALVFGGPLVVRGKVAGDAVAVGGSVTVSGEVSADVAAVGGNVILEAGAEVLGDAVSVGGEVEIDEDARVRGQIIEVPFGPNLRFGAWPSVLLGGHRDWKDDDYSLELSPWGMATDFMWEAFKLIVLALLTCLIMLIARQPLERVKNKAVTEPWKSGLVGLLVQILTAPLLVLVILILVVSIIGIPLLLLVPFMILALILIAFLGYTGVALGVGEFLKKRFGWRIESPYMILLLGVVTIQVWSIIADLLDFGWGPLWFFAVMFGVIGILIKYVAWTIGLGAAALSRFGTADGWRGQAQPAPPVPPTPPYSPPSEPRDPREPSILGDLGFSEPQAPSTLESEPRASDIDDDPSSSTES